MDDKKIKYVDIDVNLPVKLIDRLDQKFDKNKKLIDQFVTGAVNEHLAKKRKVNNSVDQFIAEAIEEAL